MILHCVNGASGPRGCGAIPSKLLPTPGCPAACSMCCCCIRSDGNTVIQEQRCRRTAAATLATWTKLELQLIVLVSIPPTSLCSGRVRLREGPWHAHTEPPICHVPRIHPAVCSSKAVLYCRYLTCLPIIIDDIRAAGALLQVVRVMGFMTQVSRDVENAIVPREMVTSVLAFNEIPEIL